jgi:CRP/FNR family transcriptional regulator, cyclic AMP receptor protein
MAEPSIREILSANAFFSGLAPESRDFLAGHASMRRLQQDEALFHVGDRAGHFYLIHGGNVSVQVPAIEGPVLELQNLGSGAVAGWSWLIAPYRWAFQARAVEPTEIIEFDGAAVLEHCEQDPQFGYELLKRFSALMSERLQFARQKMMEEWKPAGFA